MTRRLGTPDLLPGCSRRCGVWLSPHVSADAAFIVDTAAFREDQATVLADPAAPFPADCLLVVLHPTTALTWQRTALTMRVGGAALAAGFIEDQCRADAALRARLRWTCAVPT